MEEKNYSHELEERYQQLKNDFFLSTEHFQGGVGLANDMMLRLIEDDVMPIDHIFANITNIYENHRRLLKSGAIFKNESYYTKWICKPNRYYACLDKSLKFCVRRFTPSEFEGVSYFMPYMDVDNAFKIIEDSNTQSQEEK